jgi:hypothetical protein
MEITSLPDTIMEVEQPAIKASEKVTVESITLSEILSRPLGIPEYQRPYVWEENDIEKLLKQIKKHKDSEVDDKPMFYLGSIVLHDNKGQLDIIDGQQRLTTLLIIQLINVSHDIGITYDNLISQHNINKNYAYLKKIDATLLKIDFKEINVTVITTTSQDDAYNFFETLNTGGKKLSGIDILKAHHLRDLPSSELNNYAIQWEKDQKYIEEVIKILLRARKWNVLNFEEGPSRRSSEQDWRKSLTEEFIVDNPMDMNDFAFGLWMQNGSDFKRYGNKYAIRQPISDGKNFIHYLFSFVPLYKALFVINSENCFYEKFHKDIISVVDGTIDLKSLYEIALLCYASRFGLNNITEAALLIFRNVYSLRLTDKTAVQERTVINYSKEKMIIDLILSLVTEEQVLKRLRSKKITIAKQEGSTGVKNRFKDRILRLDDNGLNIWSSILKEFVIV